MPVLNVIHWFLARAQCKCVKVNVAPEPEFAQPWIKLSRHT